MSFVRAICHAGAIVGLLTPPSGGLALAQPPENGGGHAATGPAPTTVRVQGLTVTGRRRSTAQRLRESAEAVQVVETKEAKARPQDMGQVLGREHGVSIRRAGGLGSGHRFNLAGLEGEQVRFYVDGIPLELAGFGLGLANVPVDLFERVEIFKGVVPVRLGADALGGAVNLVTDEKYRQSSGAVGYQVGSFGLHRISAAGRYHHATSGFVGGAHAFHDRADNDYKVDVEVPDATGRLRPERVRRFHDGYVASGGAVEAGLAERAWAKRLSLRGFATTYQKQLPHNIVMTVPYGAASHGETSYGGTLRYDQSLGRSISLSATAHTAHRSIQFTDRGDKVYDWYGNPVRDRIRPGEVGQEPVDRRRRRRGSLRHHTRSRE